MMSAPFQQQATAGAALRSGAAMAAANQVMGHVFDPSAPDRRFVVELLLDGYSTALARADLYDRDLAKEGAGDGCYGFVFTIDPLALQSSRRIEIRLANSGEIVGAPLEAQAPPLIEKDQLAGEARWEGGLRLTGWVAGDPSRAQSVRAVVDGETVATALATGWTHIGEGVDVRAYRRFDLHLPARFADGRSRAARVLNEDGAELAGSPCAFAAFPDGLARFLEGRAEIESEKLRGEYYDRLVPQSLPFAMFEEWREAFPPPAPVREEPARIAVAFIGGEELEASVASLQAQQGCDWVAAALEGGGPLEFDNASLLQFLDGEGGDRSVLVFAPSGAVLQPQALALLAQALDEFPSANLAYADFTLAGPDGAEWPVALPAFDYERMLEQGCGALFFAARASHVRAAAEAGASDLFRLFFFDQDRRRTRGLRRGDPHASLPVHQPGFLARLPRLPLAECSHVLTDALGAHLSARGAVARISAGQGALLPSARVARPAPRGKVSILIPTRDRADLLEACFDSLVRTVELARHEIIVLDNDSVEPATATFFERASGHGARILKMGGPFNFARIINKGASVASGEFLLLLNNDVEALQPGWLEEMLSRMAEPDVGAVGAALLWPSRVFQHGGVVLGPKFAAVHAFSDRIDGDPGYADLLRAAHECSAVTAACLLTDRRLFLETGGLDGSSYPINFNDVDYCLKLRSRGLRVVLTPHAKLLHRESASRGLDVRADQTERFHRELRNLRTAWRDALLADPTYNPMLSLDLTPFSALAWPPRSARPRQPAIALPHPIPPGF